MTTAFIQNLGMANNPEAAALLIERTFNEGRADQYKRELTTNAIQAGATEILVTAVRPEDLDGVEYGFKAAFVDNGIGMASSKIVDYIGELFNGASSLGEDGNFQMGARVSTLPFNHLGVIVASWTEDEPDGTLIHIAYDEEARIYGVVPMVVGGHLQETGIPPTYLHHPVIKEAGHGTVVVLLGSEPGDHTIGDITRDPSTGEFVYPDERGAEADWAHYNSKYWDLPDGVRLRTMWAVRYLDKWADYIPKGSFYQFSERASDDHKFYQRSCEGLKNRIDQYAEHHGSEHVEYNGHGATVHWALFPEILARGPGSYAIQRGLVLGLFGERHHDEIYNLQVKGRDSTRSLERYGLSRKELRDRMVIVVEPDPSSAKFIGARPSSSRRRLLIANDELPHDGWGEVFAENLPKAIKDRLDELNGEHSKDEKERQKRLRDRLRDFFGRPYKATKNGDKPVLPTETPGATPRDIGETREPRGGTGKPKPKTGRRTGFGDHPSTDEDNPKGAQYPQHPRQEIDVQWVAPEFEDRPGILAHWVGGASRVLQMNSDHPLLLALIHDAQVGRQASKRDEVAKISREAIADHLVATILAAEMFVRSDLTAGQATLSKKFVDNAVTDETLTALCLDVPAMAHLISQRFKGRAGFRASVDEAA